MTKMSDVSADALVLMFAKLKQDIRDIELFIQKYKPCHIWAHDGSYHCSVHGKTWNQEKEPPEGCSLD